MLPQIGAGLKSTWSGTNEHARRRLRIHGPVHQQYLAFLLTEFGVMLPGVASRTGQITPWLPLERTRQFVSGR